MRSLGWLLSFALWGTATQTVNFDSAKLGAVPPGWTAVTPESGSVSRWEIVKDPSAPSPPYVFAHVCHDAAPGRPPMAIFDRTSVKDGDLSVKLKPVAGKEDRDGGIIWRYQDPKNYYLLRANALDNDIMLYKVEDGKRIALASKGAASSFGVKHPVPANQWSMLKVQFRGPLFSVYFNHKRLFEVMDSTFRQPGKVGLWTKENSITYFDDFRITSR